MLNRLSRHIHMVVIRFMIVSVSESGRLLQWFYNIFVCILSMLDPAGFSVFPVFFCFDAFFVHLRVVFLVYH